MCPVCISSVALVAAGVTSTGAVSAFVARSFARVARQGKTQQPKPKEVMHYDYEPDRAPEGRLAK